MTTPKIVMPELAVGQAGKEITHNDALAILDQLVQARVVDKDLATPPGSPANGAAYIVASSPTGVWVGHTDHIAYFLTAVGVWQFLIPAAGWRVWVTDESKYYEFSGSAWAQSLTLTSALNEAPIVTIASAATVNIGAAAANTISISGTTTITAFDTIASGALRRLHFQGALTLTHNGASLILPTAANIMTAAGDVAEFVSLGSGNWRCTGYERANGKALVAPTGSEISNAPAGNIAATTVQTAINELDTEKVSKAGDAMTGALSITAGTVGAPGLAISSDLDTGVYSPAANELAIALAGAQRLAISQSAISLPGAVNTGLGLSTGDASMEVGGLRSADGNAIMDFHATASSDHEFRVIRFGGINGIGGLQHTGAGELFIKALDAAPINMSTSNIERLTIQADGIIRPGADNTQKLGTAAFRWSEVFAGIGTINTSDAREKTIPRSLSVAEVSAAKQLSIEIGVYKFLESIKIKGVNAREHIGLTVQRVIEIMQLHGLDPFRYGFICLDAWPEQAAIYNEEGECTRPYRAAGDLFGFRYDQLMLFIAAGFEARLQALESRG